MPRLEFHGVTKRFDDTTVIPGFNAKIEDGEFLVLLGPSGCGKSTLLRMIAGLTELSDGELWFDDKMVNDLQPTERGAAFVFQSYALYPHMTVRANISFPLIMEQFRSWHHLPGVDHIMHARAMRRPEIADKVTRIARQLELEPLLERRPASLSGGQRQRVALARALVRDPALYLLDEPLSNLDAKLRTQMRSEITTLHRRVGKTFIYVTHDQVEAMTMATRIVVMNAGRIQQIDTPDGIYNRPANTFVARFVGSPPMNLIEVGLDSASNRLSHGELAWPHERPIPGGAATAMLGLRPEALRLGPAGSGAIPARVKVIERLGAETVVGCHIGGTEEDATDEPLIDTDLVFVRVQGGVTLGHGAVCALSYNPEDTVWFDSKTGDRIALPKQAPGRA